MTVSSLSSLAAGIQRSLTNQNARVANTVSALVSGNRLTQASTDVAALSASVSLQNQVTGLRAASVNVAQAQSLLQVADGAAGQIASALDRATALATQANSGALTSEQRGQLNQEFQNIRQEIDRLAKTTNFNGQNLLDGTFDASKAGFQVGADAGDSVNLALPDLTDATLFDGADIDILTADGAQAALAAINTALDSVTASRADIGSFQGALGFAQANLASAIQNQDAARSVLADTDLAETSTESAQARVQQRASIALLAQSNRLPANILQLLND